MKCARCGRQPGQCNHQWNDEERRAAKALALGYRHWRYDQPQLRAPWETP